MDLGFCDVSFAQFLSPVSTTTTDSLIVARGHLGHSSLVFSFDSRMLSKLKRRSKRYDTLLRDLITLTLPPIYSSSNHAPRAALTVTL